MQFLRVSITGGLLNSKLGTSFFFMISNFKLENNFQATNYQFESHTKRPTTAAPNLRTWKKTQLVWIFVPKILPSLKTLGSMIKLASKEIS